MRMPAFPFTTSPGIGILPANKRARRFLCGAPFDWLKETHIRAGILRRGKRCASLQEVWA
jgi:hypothetical protein